VSEVKVCCLSSKLIPLLVFRVRCRASSMRYLDHYSTRYYLLYPVRRTPLPSACCLLQGCSKLTPPPSPPSPVACINIHSKKRAKPWRVSPRLAGRLDLTSFCFVLFIFVSFRFASARLSLPGLVGPNTGLWPSLAPLLSPVTVTVSNALLSNQPQQPRLLPLRSCYPATPSLPLQLQLTNE